MDNNESNWVSILDYAKLQGQSISTIRRHIKANILKYKQEKGKYFIQVTSEKLKDKLKDNKDLFLLKLENEKLRRKLAEYEEEITDLKTLVMVYEANEQNSSQKKVPPAPLS